jgi:tetratricopeptide (TPR) repeat protein
VVASSSEAQQVLKRLGNGSDFNDIARTESIDPSAGDNGMLGFLDPSKLRPELRAALEGLKPGQVSAIVKIPLGYAILKRYATSAAVPASGSSPAKIQALSGAGAVRLTYDYAGFAAALQAVKKFDKPEGWDRDLRAACEVRVAAIPAAMDQIHELLKRPGAPPPFLRDVNSLLGDLHSYKGELADAIAFWQDARRLAEQNSPERVPQMDEAIGVGYLQRAGLTLYKDFIFPHALHTNLSHQEKEDLQGAVTNFLSYLKRVPNDGEVRWLLNLTYMLSGGYPASVPKEYLIAPAFLESKKDTVHFRDVAAAAGLNRIGQAGGLIIDDFDNDGLLDIVTSNVNDCEPMALYHNNGDGTFKDRAAQAGLTSQTGGLNIIQTDYNNDGCKDILVLRGGWEYARRKSLLRNNCDGTFTDVTKQSGLEDPVTSTQTAVWADIDNDGNLDLFIGNENAPAQLFLNKGDGTFVDIAQQAGVATPGFAKGVVAADYDNDGYTDLYISAFNGEHHLFHNNGNRTFTDVTRAAGVEGPWTTFGAMFLDYDNDGWPDLLIAGYGASVEDIIHGYLGQPQGGETLRLYRNLGNGKFRDATGETGLKRVFMPMGLNFGDIDNDGFPDFYLGSGNPSYASPLPNVLLHNDGGKSFTDVTASSGTGVLPKGHGIAFADLDNDGDEDLFVVMGGAVPGDRQSAHLFENPGNGNNWLSLRLVGSKSNRAAIGTRIKVTVRNSTGETRLVQRTVGSGGSFGAAPLEQHIGLGKAATVEKVEIWWPASGSRQSFSGIPNNRAVEIQESSDRFRTLDRRSFHLGGR